MDRFKLFGIFTAVLCSLLILFFLLFDIDATYENWHIVMFCNTLFTGLIPIAVAVLSARTYMKSSNTGVLLMGCGMLAFGLGSILSGWLQYLTNTPNTMVTIYNVCAFACSVFHLLAATVTIKPRMTALHVRKLRLALSLAGVALFAAVLTALSFHNLLPAFLDGQGSARIRTILLWLTIAFLFASAVSLNQKNGDSRPDYLFWYSLALMAMTAGLFGVAMMKAMETPLVWAGRLSQYVGCVFALLSMFAVLDMARKRGVSSAEIMADFITDAETNYRSLVESISSAIIVTDEQYTVFFCNTAAQRLFQANRQDILHATFPETMLSAPHRQLLRQMVESSKNQGRRDQLGEVHRVTAVDRLGKVFPAELSFSICQLPHGYAYTFILQDIAKRIDQEQTLVAQAEELKRKNRLLTDFFTNISHEFKTPLTLILNLIQMTEMRIGPAEFDGKEKALKNMSVMRQNAHRLLRLIANLLDVTKMDAGFMQVYYQVMDLSRWMGKLVQTVEDFAEQRGIEVRLHDESELQFIPMDGDKLDRIMLNLLSNAIKHTGRGGHIDITLSDSHSGDRLLIAVQDDGEGIPEDKKQVIFDRFHQVNTSLTRSSDGTGIGLALTKALVELLRGRIWFTSTHGEGTTFFVELPVTELPVDSNLPVMDGMALNRKVEMEFSDIL